MIVVISKNSDSCKGRGGALSVDTGGERRDRRFRGVCCRHAGGREAGRVFVNIGWGVPVMQTLEGIGPSRTLRLLLMMLKMDQRFPRAPASLPLRG